MFDFVQKNSLFIKVVLGAVALTFVGFGVGSYTTATDDPYLAQVNGVGIYKQDIERMLNGRPADAPTRQTMLDNLIRKELLLADARAAGLMITPNQLRAAIAAIPNVQENGKFSPERYQSFLAQQGLNTEAFERLVREDMLIEKQLAGIASSTLVGSQQAAMFYQLLAETRQVSHVALTPAQFASEVKIDDAAIEAYYKANTKRFQTPERVKLDYLMLSQDKLAADIKVADEEAAQYYAAHTADFAKESRRVAHILLTAPQEAAQRAKVKIEAEALLASLKADPSRFAELAKTRSQDPGSAKQGGDLGYFHRGAMVKPFEDRAFSLKKGQMSDLVETEFGFHVLRVDDIKTPPFAEVRGEVLAYLQKQKSAGVFREQLAKLTELSYQQADSLKPSADALKLTVTHSDWLTREAPAKGASPLDHAKLREAAFSEDVLKARHNSEPVEVAPGTVVVARVAEHQPAATQTLAQVTAQVRTELTAKRATELATEKGKALLARLQKGEALTQNWAAPQTVSRQSPAGLSRDGARSVFATDTSKLPAYAGVTEASGEYRLYRVDSVKPAASADQAQQTQIRTLLAQMMSNAEAMAYVESLRPRFKVELKQTPTE